MLRGICLEEEKTVCNVTLFMANLGHDDISLEPSRLISILVNSRETEEVQNLQLFQK